LRERVGTEFLVSRFPRLTTLNNAIADALEIIVGVPQSRVYKLPHALLHPPEMGDNRDGTIEYWQSIEGAGSFNKSIK
jgi:hypothetical protein